MTKNEFSKSIMKSVQLYLDLNIFLSIRCGCSLNASNEFKKLSLDKNSRYDDLYMVGLRNQDFNFILTDYSYFQFSLYDEQTFSVRYAFYPNPIVGESPSFKQECDESFDNGTINYEEYSQLMSEIDSNQYVPLIRYEYDQARYSDMLHPAAHFHIGYYQNDRWPASLKLTPLMFSLKICKLYYAHIVQKGPTEKNEFTDLVLDGIMKEKPECATVEDDYFSANEKKLIYFS